MDSSSVNKKLRLILAGSSRFSKQQTLDASGSLEVGGCFSSLVSSEGLLLFLGYAIFLVS